MKYIRDIIQQKEYSFLKTEPCLGTNTALLCFGGSISYGTDVETSDVDIRGLVLNTPASLIGMSDFEQYIHGETDTVIYAINKAVSLFLSCNPNAIEMLGVRPEHCVINNPAGQVLIDNRHMFLSRKAVGSFGGYAESQLRRLQNALAHDKYEDAAKERHILGSLQNAMRTFKDRYSDGDEGVRLYVKDNELCADVSLCEYPVRQLSGMFNEITSIVRGYDKLNQRNKKKDDTHLNKHAMHLIRLFLMGIDIFEKEEIITYRENERELLLDIRKGKFQREDGCFNNEFFDMLDGYKKRMEYAIANSSLPVCPDYKRVEEMLMSINRGVILGHN